MVVATVSEQNCVVCQAPGVPLAGVCLRCGTVQTRAPEAEPLPEPDPTPATPATPSSGCSACGGTVIDHQCVHCGRRTETPDVAASGVAVLVFPDGQVFELAADREIVLGRGPTSPLARILEDYDAVSRMHGRVRWRPDPDGAVVEVLDAGSTNGIYISEQQIEPDVWTVAPEEFRLGRGCRVSVTWRQRNGETR